jgi:hypothetical protein
MSLRNVGTTCQPAVLPTKRRGKWQLKLTDLNPCTVHLGRLIIQCTNSSDKRCPKITPKFSACTENTRGALEIDCQAFSSLEDRTRRHNREYHSNHSVLVPVSEHGYFVASWWRTPLRHPQKLLLTNRFYFQQTSSINEPVGKRKGCSLSGRSPAPITDSFNVATMARKHSVLNLREINRNNKHTALASVWTYYGWVSLVF